MGGGGGDTTRQEFNLRKVIEGRKLFSEDFLKFSTLFF